MPELVGGDDGPDEDLLPEAGEHGQTAPSAVERVANGLRDAVRSGDLVPGQRLVESDLTREHGVSRGSLREAIRRLAAEGMLEVQHNRGARVRRLTHKEIIDLYNIRESLEALAAQLAARNMKRPAQRHALNRLMKQAAGAVEKGQTKEYIELNERFHDLIVKSSDNPALVEMIERLHTPVFRIQLRALMSVAAIRVSHRDHEKIATAVLAGDEGAAARQMRAHIRRSRELL